MAPLPRSRLLLLLLAVILPQFGLAWVFGIPVNPFSLPEPLLSLLILTVLSLFVHFFLKPIALDYTISPEPTSIKRYDAAWIASNIQFLSFIALWCAVGTKNEVLPDGSTRKVDHTGFLAPSLFFGFFILVGVNAYYAGTRPYPPATEAASEEITLLEIEQKGKEDSPV